MSITQVPRKKAKPIPKFLAFLKARASGWMVVLVVLLFMQLTTLGALSQTPNGGATHRFVQLSDGQTIEAQAVAGDYRSPEVVSKFVGDIITLGYKWDRSKQYIEDHGVLFPPSYAAVGNLFTDETELAWGKNFAKKYGLINGSQKLENSYAMLTSDPIIEPKGNGLWAAEVHAIRFITDGKGRILNQEKMFFKFGVQAINPKLNSNWELGDPGLAPYMERFWSAGLGIVEFVDMRGLM